ncbi:hypothetical protein PS870_01692 [Pseudomonas fluorescens]|jgi:Protein of unknown function (DUF1654).|uniref:DUF1654 domain-containing protein n=1 Tax=Pseudomonas fluorescens TaxID=294 RepID=A0A5E7J714_PSEFL|nr:DUF1654 domain-containing protein [Pseudomonas fluorescens]VVO79053.1 hypothetical protein PS870_01692 [Pseudomonas fluorescens]
MAKKAAAPRPPSSYELMGMRIQKIINSTGAQASKRATIYKSPDESPDDWAQLLEDIGEADNVTVAHQDDGGVQIFWVVPKED